MKKSIVLVSTVCTRPQFIKYLNLPSCVNCLHFLEYKKSEPYDTYYCELGRCSKFGIKNMISGEINYDFASTCRTDKERCGTNGIYYIHLPKNP